AWDLDLVGAVVQQLQKAPRPWPALVELARGVEEAGPVAERGRGRPSGGCAAGAADGGAKLGCRAVELARGRHEAHDRDGLRQRAAREQSLQLRLARLRGLFELVRAC